jgi:hypothetical protein
VTRAFLFLATMSLRLLHGLCKQNLPVSPQERFLSVLSSHPLHSEPKTFSFRSKQVLGFNFWTPSCGDQRSSSRLDDPYSIGQIKVSLFLPLFPPPPASNGPTFPPPYTPSSGCSFIFPHRNLSELMSPCERISYVQSPSSCLDALMWQSISKLHRHALPVSRLRFPELMSRRPHVATSILHLRALMWPQAFHFRAHVSTPSCGN